MPQLKLSCLDLSKRHLDTLQALLTRHVPHSEVWAYGSRVSGGAHEGSDLDLVLRNPNDLSIEVVGVNELKDALQQSQLPMLVETHQWCLLPTSFHRNIEEKYVVLHPSRDSSSA